MSGLLYISEMDTLGHDATGRVIMAPVHPLLVEGYSVLITDSKQVSQIFGSQTRALELHPDAECWFHIAQNPNPVMTAGHIGAGDVRYIPLRIGVTGLRIGIIGAAP